jgi:hypothetical protein
MACPVPSRSGARPSAAIRGSDSWFQEIVLAHHRRYRYRQVTAELHRRSMAVNLKRVLRVMRTDNLLAVRFRKFVFYLFTCGQYLSTAIHARRPGPSRYQATLAR